MLSLRYATADDLRFVKDSWFESFRRGGFAPEIGFDLFSEGQRNLIDDTVQKMDTRVAFPEKTPDEIIGWIGAEKEVVHYLYVKHAYRKMGFADRLIELCGPFKFYSHKTKVGLELAKKHGFRYNPYLTVKGNGP